jgi:hypothetical protein
MFISDIHVTQKLLHTPFVLEVNTEHVLPEY